MDILSNKPYALITGASSGMGFQYSRQLAARGYNLIMVALYQDETDAAKSKIEAEYPQIDLISIGIDLSLGDSPKNIYDMVKSQIPDANVEVLINNAGVLNAIHFRNMSAAQISRIIMIHNHSLAMLCHYFIPEMAQRRKGYVLNVSSLAAWFPYPLISTYASTKAFVKVFTRALRIEYHGSGVEICTIYFGAVQTNLYTISDKLIRLAKAFGVMITAEKAAQKALKMMFSGRSGKIPGFLNRIAIFIVAILPHTFISVLEKSVTKKWNLK